MSRWRSAAAALALAGCTWIGQDTYDDRIKVCQLHTFYQDDDRDGFGDGNQPSVEQCEAPAGHVDAVGDCDDDNAGIHPDAVELCDVEGVDENCDGQIGGPPVTAYADADGDGFGDPAMPAGQVCEVPPGFVSNAADCDDGAAGVHPEAAEMCNGIDDNCDNLVDEEDNDVVDGQFWVDADEDGYGDPDERVVTCDGADPGFAANGDDCDDTDEFRNPGMVELCDGIDADCIADNEGVLVVDTNTPYTSIQAAIDDAPPDGTIRVCDGTYNERLVFTSRRLTIESLSGSAATVLDVQGASNVALIQNSTVTLQGFTLTNGNAPDPAYAGGLDVVQNSVVTLNDVVVAENVALAGAGIRVLLGSTLVAVDTDVRNNIATVSTGGGVLLDNTSDATFLDSAIRDNEAVGAAGGVDVGNGASLMLDNTVVEGNTLGLYNDESLGGGLLIGDGATVEMVNGSQVFNNEALCGGGVGMLDDATLTGGEIVSNVAEQGAGVCVYAPKGASLISGTTIALNHAQASPLPEDGAGGGVLAVGTLALNEVDIVGNTADALGGGVATASALVILVGGSVVDNVTTGEGGAMYVGFGFPVQIDATDTVFARNSALGAAAVYIEDDSVFYGCNVDPGSGADDNVPADLHFQYVGSFSFDDPLSVECSSAALGCDNTFTGPCLAP